MSTQRSIFDFMDEDDAALAKYSDRPMIRKAPPVAGCLLPFGGATFDPHDDGERMASLLDRVRALMDDGKWRTLREIVVACGGSEGGVSARLRDMRKAQFGGVEVERRRRGDPANGLHEYRVPPGQREFL